MCVKVNVYIYIKVKDNRNEGKRDCIHIYIYLLNDVCMLWEYELWMMHMGTKGWWHE